jgi:hypothetical protein
VIRWRDLGHTHATLLTDGVDVVWERLGQASATIMLTIHQHVHPGTGRHAADGPGIMRSRTRWHERSIDHENRTGRPTTTPALPWSPAHPPAAPGSPGRPADGPAAWVFEIRARSALGAPGPLLGTFLAPSAGLCGTLPRPPCPAFQRRSSWLDQAGARRALAVPPRGTSDASTSAATSSRRSPEPSVRSRQPPSAAA